MSSFTIILADDHVLFRSGLRKLLEDIPDCQVIGEVGDGLELLEMLKKTAPDLVVLDISMPNLRGLEAAREVKKLYPQTRILVLTMHKEQDFLQQGIETGVDGFLLKEDADSELISAVSTVRKGERYLSPLLTSKLADLAMRRGKKDPLTFREREIAKLLAEGKSSKDIADLLYISIFTVRRHRDNIMKKLNIKSLADLVRYALNQGYITPST